MSEPQPIPVRETPEYREGWRKAVEECARVADQWEDSKEFGYDPTAVQIAAAIRALKDKP